MSKHDFTQYLKAEMSTASDSGYDEIFDTKMQFTIEISIPMRKPKGHFSRAPGVVLKILEEFEGGTFFEGQGYWQGVQEPVIYILISIFEEPRSTIEKVKQNLVALQKKLKQQEVFVKINGRTFVDSVLPQDTVIEFPDQWEFDDDMRLITANKARKDEHYKIAFGRKEYKNKYFADAMNFFKEAFSALRESEEVLQDLHGRDCPYTGPTADLLSCTVNILGIATRADFKQQEDSEDIEMFIDLINKLLPPNSKSKFTMEVLSPHAEARIRGNRLMLFQRIGKHILSEEKLISDGIFGLKQLQLHLKEGGNPFLEKDPIPDIIAIRKWINNIASEEPAEVNEIISQFGDDYPVYSDEFHS